jgi:hypothetical protein
MSSRVETLGKILYFSGMLLLVAASIIFCTSARRFYLIEYKQYSPEEQEEINALFTKGNQKALAFSYMLNSLACLLFLRTSVLMI